MMSGRTEQLFRLTGFMIRQTRGMQQRMHSLDHNDRPLVRALTRASGYRMAPFREPGLSAFAAS